jgi:hypothetical protein
MLRRQLRSVSSGVSRLARKARAKPALALAVLAVVIAVIAGLVWLFKGRRRGGRREGWAFQGKVPELSQKHAENVASLCRRGMTWTQITSDDKYNYLAKYDGKRAFDACRAGLDQLKEDQKVKGWKAEWGTKCNSTCSAKNRANCPSSLLWPTHPCLNGTKDNPGNRCCDPCGKNCVAIDQVSNYDYIKGKPSSSTSTGGGTSTSTDTKTNTEWGGGKSQGSNNNGCGGTPDDRYVWLYTNVDGNGCGYGDRIAIWKTGQIYNLRKVQGTQGKDGTITRNWENSASALWIPANKKVTLYENMSDDSGVYASDGDTQGKTHTYFPKSSGRWEDLTKLKGLRGGGAEDWNDDVSGVRVD